MTSRQRLQTILSGQVPDHPPHFELAFQLSKEMFGMDRGTLDRQYSGPALSDALERFHIEISERLIEELGYAAVAPEWYDSCVDRFRCLRNLKKAVGSKALVFAFSDSGVFWMPSGHDMMDFVVRMFQRPEEMHAEARLKADAAMELVRRQVDAGVDFIVQNTDFGFNQGPFVSPKHFAEFVTPYMTEIVAHMHDLGVPVILHSDGNLNAILDQLHSTRVDGYQSVDPQGGMDIRSVREKYPDWLLMGNVNCSMLQNVDDTRVRESVRYCMQYGGKGRRYVFSTSNCIFSGMPPASYRIMLNEYQNLCQA
jgi:uroporphyrinogen decarboxylase